MGRSHLTVIGLSITSLLTGLRIAAVSRPEILPFSALLPQGNLHDIHLFSAMGLIAVTVVYLFLCLTRRWPPGGRGGFHHRVIQSSYLLLPLLIVTGTALYFGTVVATVQDIHYCAALGLIVFLLLHAGIMFVQFGADIQPHHLSRAPHRRRRGHHRRDRVHCDPAGRAEPTRHAPDPDATANRANGDHRHRRHRE